MPMPRSLGSAQVTFAPADLDAGRRDVEQARRCLQQGRLAAARRPEQHQELAGLDVEVEVSMSTCTAPNAQLRVALIETLVCYRLYPFTAPAAMPRTNQRAGDEIDDQRHQRRSAWWPPC